MNLTGRLVLSATLFGLIATGATAAKLKVPKHYPTIQAAVDAASAGDEIEIQSGVYQESITIPSGRAGLTIRGKGGVILDSWAHGGSSWPYLPAIRIESPNVTLQGFTIRNSRGFAVDVFASSATMKQMKFSGTYGGVRDNGNPDLRLIKCKMFAMKGNEGVHSTGNNLLVSGCTFKNMYGVSVLAEGNDVVVTKNTISNASDYYAIKTRGTNARIEENAISRCYDGIVCNDASGQITIRDNQITNVEEDGIDVQGGSSPVSHKILIQKNRIATCGDAGIRVEDCTDVEILQNRLEADSNLKIRDSYNLLVKKNRITGVEGDAIDSSRSSKVIVRKNVLEGGGVKCRGSSTALIYGVVIDQNKISNAVKDDAIYVSYSDQISITNNDIRDVATEGGIEVVCTTVTSCEVLGNRVRQAMAHGISFQATSSSNVFVENNEVSRCGYEKYYGGYRLSGYGLTVRSNRSIDNAGDGFHLEGDKQTVSQNVAIGNGVDGIDLEGDLGTLEDNTCRDNDAEGIEVNGNQNTVRQNAVTKNRIDLANDGIGNLFAENIYQTGGSATEPEID